MDIVVDASTPLVRLRQVSIWSFDLPAWGECTQAATEKEARSLFARRVGVADAELEVREKITGREGVFAEDLLPADDDQIARTLEILDAQRAETFSLLAAADDKALDMRDGSVKQPAWMPWRTPRKILRHIADTESRTYPLWCGLPQMEPVEDLHDELERSARHIREVIATMPRTFRSSHDGGIWTPVKLLRRLAWHERVELVFLRRRLRHLIVRETPDERKG